MYEWLKLLHILSSVVMVGTGFGSAFYMFMANRSNNLQAQLVVSRLIVKADWWFTTPTIIFQPVSGLALVYSQAGRWMHLGCCGPTHCMQWQVYVGYPWCGYRYRCEIWSALQMLPPCPCPLYSGAMHETGNCWDIPRLLRCW